ncbi:ferritin [Clostridium sp. A1-XYC3]|uniref:Ferritin n=1 Tax=Clostridium tanneri TaxID=3037988 RepID=A0ABU4JUI6_9CLOT|nr:ferritin [Clostridium sp. A1-XYC3]MDW8801599.1 ferritin [Clostridium sp. A1-XYC3]
MLSENLMKAINDQINYELYSANAYLAMQAYCASKDLDGFANFFNVQAQEENFHAMKFFNYLNQVGGRVLIEALPSPENNFESILHAFKEGLKHEKNVTKRVYNLMDIATDEREHATISLLKWFIDEQVEEETTFNNIVKRLERVSEDAAALYALDAELASRVFTPPTTA